MKKLLILALVLFLLPVSVSAELSDLSYDELLALRNDVNAEIMSRPEWKQVVVPAGTWIVGQDIPAGVYSITSASGELARFISKNADGKQIDYIWLSKEKTLGRTELLEGYIIELTDSVIFAPPVSLDF